MGGGAEKVLEDPTEGQTGAEDPSARNSPSRWSALLRSSSFMGILFTHPIRTFQQYSKNALGMLIYSEQVVIFYSPHSPKN
jgi:hypothetical protein